MTVSSAPTAAVPPPPPPLGRLHPPATEPTFQTSVSALALQTSLQSPSPPPPPSRAFFCPYDRGQGPPGGSGGRPYNRTASGHGTAPEEPLAPPPPPPFLLLPPLRPFECSMHLMCVAHASKVQRCCPLRGGTRSDLEDEDALDVRLDCGGHGLGGRCLCICCRSSFFHSIPLSF